MVKISTCLEVCIERKDIDALKKACEVNGFGYEGIDEREFMKDYITRLGNQFDFSDPVRCFVTGKIHDIDMISILDKLDITIGIKYDL